ncbi:MAG: hypothetical protein ISS28_01235 [Candidatus Cloacimonetes bacterium]|nr:hypothetical protein [Candidatus Cloacimonadota bacterium]MBL7085711.1 hypothetical protein [Candidatus Cloacimonadota bacterium]
MIKKRNLLCAKLEEKLDLGELLLYKPYKNILIKLRNLVVNIHAEDFDPVAKVYNGLLSVPKEIREYYESLLGITSYYHHSQGGRGKYIEKKIASSYESCSLDIELKNLPFWFEYPVIHKKKGIFTQKGLTAGEKRLLKTSKWDWLGDRSVNTDVGNILLSEHTLILCELKNRVDTGGTAGRREIWTSEKFGIYVDYLISNVKIFRKGSEKFSFIELLKYFGFQNLEIYLGVLFDITDNPSSIKADKINGFYSSSKKGFDYLTSIISSSNNLKVIDEDDESLYIKFKTTYSEFQIKIGALYGNNVISTLFRRESSVSGLLLLKYDDIWFSLLLSIDERANLLKFKKNYSITVLELLERDAILRQKYYDLIVSECKETILNDIVTYILDNYNDNFDKEILLSEKNKISYLADILQFLCATEF